MRGASQAPNGFRPRGFAEKRDISGAFGVPRIPTRPPARDDRTP
jgi:hypothetical protein